MTRWNVAFRIGVQEGAMERQIIMLRDSPFFGDEVSVPQEIQRRLGVSTWR